MSDVAAPARTSTPEQDLATFRERITAYQSGAIDGDTFKRYRLSQGVYGIRGKVDVHMVRIKIPGGRLSADQLEVLANATDTYATGHGHVTTRQAMQLYQVPVAKVPELLKLLDTGGLTTREACGNSVRNITASPYTGLCPDERFDVTPYVRLVMAHYLRNPRTQVLPRKFKMSFSGCAHDHALAAIHDVGMCAADEGGRLGFKLYVGGGLGPTPRTADLLEPFTPVAQLMPTLDAILEVFDRHGERANRSRARMKFLLIKIGFPAFKQLVEEARQAALKRDGYAPLPVPAPIAAATWLPTRPSTSDAAAERWLETNTQPQRQAGLWIATVRLPLGDVTSQQMRALAALARAHAQGALITMQWQDLGIPGVKTAALLPLYQGLAAIGLAQAEARRIQDVTSCPGAETCQIGITASRGLARVVAETLEPAQYQDNRLADLRIKMSGCPNSCGQHQIADIGFFGAAKSVSGKLIPHYQVLLGGAVTEGLAQFGIPIVRLPARRVPEALRALLTMVQAERASGEPFRTFVERMGVARLQALLEPFTSVDGSAASDWGATTPFSIEGLGSGECAG